MKTCPTSYFAKMYRMNNGDIRRLLTKLGVKAHSVTKTAKQTRYLWPQAAAAKALADHFQMQLELDNLIVVQAVEAQTAITKIALGDPNRSTHAPAMQALKDEHIANRLVGIERTLADLLTMTRSILTYHYTRPGVNGAPSRFRDPQAPWWLTQQPTPATCAAENHPDAAQL